MKDFVIKLTDLTQTDVLNFIVLHSISVPVMYAILSLHDTLNGNW